jgi:hypothetical protein
LPPAAATTLGSLHGIVQNYAHLVCLYMVSDTAAAAVSRRRVKVTLADVAEPVAGAYHAMMEILIAAAQHADQLEGVAGPGSVGQMHSSVTAGMRIWRQVLGSEQGRQLPQAILDVGSMLCAAMPTRFGCNEPSCCCLDKPSELQLAEGKGTKCSTWFLLRRELWRPSPEAPSAC